MSNAPGKRGEFELIADLFAPLTRGAESAKNLRDDAAFLKVTPGHELVVTVDMVIAGVHFRLDDPPDLIARKALRVNLSDLAAKGAKPIGFLQALALNDGITDAYLERYARGLAADVATFGCPLLGGDTTSSQGPLTVAITAFGEVETGKGVLRAGAKPGDLLFVTGTIGDAALGLACLMGSLPTAEALVQRYQLPQPRVGLRLADFASACLDVSDGLVADVGHLCNASGVGAVIERAKVPLSADARKAVALDSTWWEKILTGGDDYELAFTVPPSKKSALAGLNVTEIGRIMTGSGVSAIDESGQPLALRTAGYQHR